MAWKLDDSRSIHSQLTAVISRRIISGYYPPGSRLSSVRELADEAGVNPNTMQRALSQLEASGVIFAQRTSGRFVTTDREKIDAMRKDLALDAIKEYVGAMSGLGFSPGETEALLHDYQQGKGGDQSEVEE